MELTGVHLLLTYQCNYECEHCFVWGSPWQQGTMALRTIDAVLEQSHALGTVDWIYFEGGEPFLYYPILAQSVDRAASMGFNVGIVTNGYWATSVEDATAWLEPFVGKVEDLSVSCDPFHGDDERAEAARRATKAAEALEIPVGTITVVEKATNGHRQRGRLPRGASGVMYRGRAAEQLAPDARRVGWLEYEGCPHEDLREPGRVHVDPFGSVHVCQGIVIGNVLETSLVEICHRYDPDRHPIVGPLLEGGPTELAFRYGFASNDRYADACHLCYACRAALRERFPIELRPDAVYGVGLSPIKHEEAYP